MSANTDPTGARLLKGLANGSYDTLLDEILQWISISMGRSLGGRSLPRWISLLLFFLLLVLTATGLSLALREMSPLRTRMLFVELPGAALMYVSGLMIMDYIDHFRGMLRDTLIAAMLDEDDLQDLERWLHSVSNRQAHFGFGLLVMLGLGAYSVTVLSEGAGGWISYGSAFLVLAFDFGIGLVLYLFIHLVTFAFKAGVYHLDLYEPDPTSSATYLKLSSTLNGLLYRVATICAGITLLYALTGLLTQPVLITLLLLAWSPVVVLFLLVQNSLSRIVREARGRALAQVQGRIELLKGADQALSPDTLTHIIKLMDYHDRIKATRSSALDLSAGLSFLNSMLLPLIAFVVGNLNALLDLLRLR